jgi:ribokinase
VSEVFVVGSLNQDLVLKVERRPEPGETVTDAKLLPTRAGKEPTKPSPLPCWVPG